MIRNELSWGKRIASSLLCMAVLVSLLSAFPLPVKAAGYDSLDALGASEWWHYNGILFGDWVAEQADVEGAIAVKGNTKLATKESFSIGANAENNYPAMGDYDPSDSDYPIAILGTDTAKGARLNNGPNKMPTFGDVVMRTGSEGYYNALPSNGKFEFHKGGAMHYQDGALIDSFFHYSRNLADTILDTFQGAVSKQLSSNQVFGPSKPLYSHSASSFEATSLMSGLNGEKILVINITDATQINIGELHFPPAYENYDLIVMNFPNVGSASFGSGGKIFIEGYPGNYGVYWNYPESGGKAIYDMQVKWANKMVWLFPHASNITIQEGVVGSIVAPDASISTKGGSINGMVFAKDLEQTGGFELHAYRMSPLVPKVIPPVDPEPEPEKVNISMAKRDEALSSDGVSHAGLEGARLRLEYKDKDGNWQDYYLDYEGNAGKGTFTTGTGGVVALNDLTCGLSYRFVELASPPGYDMPTGEDIYTYFDIDMDGNVTGGTYRDTGMNIVGSDGTVRVFNQQIKTKLNFWKYDSDTGFAPPVGAVFGLRRVIDSSGNTEIVNSNIVVAADGTFSLPELEIGTYLLFEHTAPAGYEQPDADLDEYYTIVIKDNRAPGAAAPDIQVTVHHWDGQEVYLNGDSRYPVANEPTGSSDDKVSVHFIKSTSDTGGTPLAGAIFDVYRELPGYDPQGQPIPAGIIEYGGTYWEIVAEETTSSDLPGNTGYFYYEDDVEVGTRYLVHEKQAPIGFQLPADPWQIVEVTGGATTFRVFFVNTRGEDDDGSFTFVKTDDEGGMVSGAVFELYQKINGSYTKIKDAFTTDGSAITFEDLEFGMYMLYEVSAPYGYKLEDADRRTYFRISLFSTGMVHDGKSESTAYVGKHIGAQSPIEIVNTPWRTEMTLYKVDRATDEPLPGVTFKVEYRARVLDEWELYTKDYPDGIYTTGADGKLTAELRVGIYRVSEISTHEGYKITTDVYDYTVTPDSPREVMLRIFNEQKVMGGMQVQKVDFNNQTEVLTGSQFMLYTTPADKYRAVLENLTQGTQTLEEIVNDDKLWAPYELPPGFVLTVGPLGILNIPGLESGVYKLVEITAPDEYTLWGDIRDNIVFEMKQVVDEGDGSVSVELGAIFGGLTEADEKVIFANEKQTVPEPAPGDALFYKVDSANGSKLEGAVFKLERKGDDGKWTLVSSGHRSNENGEILISGLYEGTYRLTETAAPADYILNGTPVEFTMEPDSSGDKVQLVIDSPNISNEKDDFTDDGKGPTGSIRVRKVDVYDNSVTLPGTTFTIDKYMGDVDDAVQTLDDMEKGRMRPELPANGPWSAYPSSGHNIHTTGENGAVEISKLRAGLYRVEEIQPPEGYGLWESNFDVIYFHLEEVEGENGVKLVEISHIYGNHLSVDGEVVFADAPLITTPPGSPGPTPTGSGGDGTNTGDHSKLPMYLLCAILTTAAAISWRVVRRLQKYER